ncbi:MAG: PP2C family serine/threonine-protein phosphatase [Isosphaeraceae bacterium]
MWKIVRGCTKGTSHLRTGQPCQDYCSAFVIESSGGPTLIAACADGAGSAELAELGAKLAVDTFLQLAVASLSSGEMGTASSAPEILRDWAKVIRRRLESEAEARNTTLRQLACTLLTAIVGTASACFSQVGDGLIVVSGADGYEHVFWPELGEYANTTHFLTDVEFEKHLQVDFREAVVQEVAMLTDGLQMLAMDWAARRIHRPFFSPMFNSVLLGNDLELLGRQLESFLNSDSSSTVVRPFLT